MSVNKIHPAIVQNIVNALPKGCLLLSISSVGPTSTEIRYKEPVAGAHRFATITKASPMIGMLMNRVMRFPAVQGQPLKDVVEKFCAQYKLLMVPGVDYDVGERQVDFDGEEFYTEVIQMLPTSPFLVGNLTFILVDTGRECEAKCLDPNDPVKRDAFILLSKPFEVTGDITKTDKNGSSLSDEAVDVICEHAKTRGGFVALTREIIEKGLPSEPFNDGVTDCINLFTSFGNFGIRFKSK